MKMHSAGLNCVNRTINMNPLKLSCQQFLFGEWRGAGEHCGMNLKQNDVNPESHHLYAPLLICQSSVWIILHTTELKQRNNTSENITAENERRYCIALITLMSLSYHIVPFNNTWCLQYRLTKSLHAAVLPSRYAAHRI